VSAELISAAELAEAGLCATARPQPPGEMQRDRIAETIGRLRRRHPESDEYDRILADRIAASLDSLDAMLEPCAAELIRAGLSVEEALAQVDRRREALYRQMGGAP
jgi:hypothetical protein